MTDLFVFFSCHTEQVMLSCDWNEKNTNDQQHHHTEKDDGLSSQQTETNRDEVVLLFVHKIIFFKSVTKITTV